MSVRNFLKIVLLCRSGIISHSEIKILSYILAPTLFGEDNSEESLHSNEKKTQWPTNAISASELQKHHEVPISKHYFYEFKDKSTNESTYVTIANQGYLKTTDGNLVSEDLLKNSQVWAFLE